MLNAEETESDPGFGPVGHHEAAHGNVSTTGIGKVAHLAGTRPPTAAARPSPRDRCECTLLFVTLHGSDEVMACNADIRQSQC